MMIHVMLFKRSRQHRRIVVNHVMDDAVPQESAENHPKTAQIRNRRGDEHPALPSWMNVVVPVCGARERE
jgi:hypothetical protein